MGKGKLQMGCQVSCVVKLTGQACIGHYTVRISVIALNKEVDD